MNVLPQTVASGSDPRLRQRVAAGVRWSAAATTISGGVTLVQLVILARVLGPRAIGIMALATVLVEFGRVVGNVGLSEAVIQRKDPTREELSSLYWLAVLFRTIVAALLVWAASLAARAFGIPELGVLLPVVALKIWIGGLGAQFEALLRKNLRFTWLATATVGGSLTGFTVAISSALIFDQGIWSLVWGVLATAIVHTGIYSWYGWRQDSRPYLHFSPADVRPYLRFGVFQSGASILNFVSTRIDQVLIGALMGPTVLGLYAVAFDVSRQPVSRILPMVAGVAFPALSAVQDDGRRLRAGYLRMLGLLVFALVPMFIGVAAIAPVAVPLFFGPQWVEAVPLVQILAFAVLLSSFASVSRSLTAATGHVSWDFYWNLGAALLLPPVIYLAARTGNPVIVAVSLLGLHATLSVAGYYLALRRILGPFVAELLRAAAVPLGAAVVMGGLVAAGLGLMAPYPRAIQFAVLAVAGGAFYFASTLLLHRQLVVRHLALLWQRRVAAEGVSAPGRAR